MTQAELASRVGLAANHVARIEKGEKSHPRFETVARIAAELGLSLDGLAAACGLKNRGTGGDTFAAGRKAALGLRRAQAQLEQVQKSLNQTAGELERAAGSSEPALPKTSRQR